MPPKIMANKMECPEAETVHKFLQTFCMRLDRIGNIKGFVGIAAAEQINGDNVILRRQKRDYFPPDEEVGRNAVDKQHRLPVSCPEIGHLMAGDSADSPVPVRTDDLNCIWFCREVKGKLQGVRTL